MADETKIITVKRGTANEWESEIQPLDKGELGYDMTVNKYKGGDGETPFVNLPAFVTEKDVDIEGSLVYSGPRRVPTLTEPVGVVLVQNGGGAGVWDRVDLNGEPISTPVGYFSSRPEYQLNVTDIDSQSMVNINKFHYARMSLTAGPYAGKQAWFINKTPFNGSEVHPAFLNNVGAEIDTFWVGAYEAFADGSTKAGSQNNKPPLVSIDFPTMVSRCSARNASGITGFRLIDIYQLAAIQYLALIEMGAPDSQTILGRGNCDSPIGSAFNTGYTNAIWRAIHELWGNVWCMVQGIENRNGVLWIWNKNGSQSWVNTGVTLPNSGWVVNMADTAGSGFDLKALFIPSTTTSSMGQGSWSDSFSIVKDGTTKVCYHGGSWYSGSRYGLFGLHLSNPSSISHTDIGGRLAKV